MALFDVRRADNGNTTPQLVRQTNGQQCECRQRTSASDSFRENHVQAVLTLISLTASPATTKTRARKLTGNTAPLLSSRVSSGSWLTMLAVQATRTRVDGPPVAVAPSVRALLGRVPVHVFGMALGLGGLTNAWLGGEQLWGVSPLVGFWLKPAVSILWLVCLGVMLLKWLLAREAAWLELRDPGRFAFYALVPMSTLVLSVVLRSSMPRTAWGLFVVGLLVQTVIAVASTATSWRGERQLEAIDSSTLMPAVGGSFVAAAACSAQSVPDLAVLFFGAGLGSWLITESLVLQRLALHALPAAKRASIGIHLTPAAIASVAYLSLTQGTPDLFAQMLFGYALLQALVTLRLVPFLRVQRFALGTWAYTFGLSALSLGAIRFGLRGQSGAIEVLGVGLFGVANAVIGWIALRTLSHALRALARLVLVAYGPSSAASKLQAK